MSRCVWVVRSWEEAPFRQLLGVTSDQSCLTACQCNCQPAVQAWVSVGRVQLDGGHLQAAIVLSPPLTPAPTTTTASSAACSWVEAALDDLDIHPVAAMLPQPEAHIVPMVTNEEVTLQGNPDEGTEAREVHTYR